MPTGTIKFFQAQKGYGFVTPDDGGADVFLPAASVVSAGLARAETGQRLKFERAPHARGVQAISLKLIEGEATDAPKVSSLSDQVVVYCDIGSSKSEDVLDSVRTSGLSLSVADLAVSPPTVDELRNLSHQLSESGQSLVRRGDPLFFALQLDDRFIGDQEFWTGIKEHPMLINSPILVRAGKARICKTADEASAFLNQRGLSNPSAPKAVPARIAEMLKPKSLDRAVPSVSSETIREPVEAIECRNPSIAVIAGNEIEMPTIKRRRGRPPKSQSLK